jgi:hypothetical protein
MGVLALAALLAVPAMSMHDGMRGRFYDRGYGPEVGPGGVWLLMDDLTQEDLDNMTLAEIRELRETKRAELENMTLAEIRELREKKIAEMNNTTLAEMRGKYMECPYWPMGGAQGPRAGAPGAGRGCDGRGLGIAPFGGLWMLMDDLTQEDLDNMTLAEIRELRETKRAELENMTLAEIRELREKKIAEMNNTTLAEMRGKYMECPYWPMGGAQGPRGMGYGKMQR